MNMDYSKAFELLNQDTEKEHNEKAEGVVHDNFYNKGFHDGIAVLDKIRAEIERERSFQRTIDEYDIATGLRKALEIIDKYKSEEREN